MSTIVSFVLVLGLSTNLFAKDHCSLVVKAVDSEGREVEADVVVTERDGRRIERENRPGGVKFCDLGITPITVTVGSPECNQVVVRNVPLRWGETRIVSVIYDDRPCLVDPPPVAACQFLFRFIDTQHNFVKGVSLKTQTPYEEVHKADDFGRLLMKIPAGQQLLGMAAANGYGPAEVRVPCVTNNRKVEQYITLTKSGR